ncbi:tetratricopeptide repeat protein [Oceanobacillus halophilus]|uniref:Tetratricopeptide repeat protein n=1 Tax=Oceanobacillus halophilus TaxID=930130 RepID=A0A495ADJ2_9BACI|nr:tetratricopeptide repeat protein [Oceanobacillus halophilus]RKQ37932.1 tetratricopeptide repeat protein [Oceanobacillus halophilus]
METHHDKIILFPKWRKVLEEESLNALKEKQYEKALVKLNKLLSYQVDNYELITGKLICLMELGRFEEAQNLCEDLLKEEDENYFHYVHIYLTILFQTNQYDLLMDQVEKEFDKKDIPKLQEEQFKQLYEISKKMNMDLAMEKESMFFKELFQAVQDNNYVEQWRQVEGLKELKAEPTDEIIQLLVNEYVHPVTKTAIIQWLKASDILKEVAVDKFGVRQFVVPSKLEQIEQSNLVQETLYQLRDIEQENPSLFQLLRKLLHDYAYVVYPIQPQKEDYIHIAKALKIIGEEYLSIHTKKFDDNSEKVHYYIDKIQLCESLYVSIIEG